MIENGEVVSATVFAMLATLLWIFSNIVPLEVDTRKIVG